MRRARRHSQAGLYDRTPRSAVSRWPFVVGHLCQTTTFVPIRVARRPLAVAVDDDFSRVVAIVGATVVDRLACDTPVLGRNLSQEHANAVARNAKDALGGIRLVLAMQRR